MKLPFLANAVVRERLSILSADISHQIAAAAQVRYSGDQLEKHATTKGVKITVGHLATGLCDPAAGNYWSLCASNPISYICCPLQPGNDPAPKAKYVGATDTCTCVGQP
jgi:hypothetical protein